MVDDGLTKVRKWHRMGARTTLRKCWIWNKTVEDFVRCKVRGYSLNVCAGMSPIGDVKVDIEPQTGGVIKADMRNLPFEDNTFDTVVSDPPWKIGFYQRMKPFFECVRVCKVRGRIIYNAYWIPTSKFVKLEGMWVRQDTDWSNTSVISVFKKTSDVPDADKKQCSFRT
jgi:ubiquinone/menaquinone biosynthesis C-methylase UbiE